MKLKRRLTRYIRQQKFVKSFCAVVALLFCLIAKSYGIEQTFAPLPLIGNAIQSNASLQAKDDLFPLSFNSSWIANENIRFQNVKNHIILGIDPDFTSLIPNYTTDVTLLITYQDENGLIQTVSPNPTLTVEHNNDPGVIHPNKAAYSFTGGHLVDVTVVSISNTAANLVLENTIKVERYFNFDATQAGSGLGTSLLPSNEILVEWDNIPGAEEYQLEWLHVNDYDGVGGVRNSSELTYDFDINSNRISTKNTEYKITAAFEQGYLLLRYRGTTISGADNTALVAGLWSTEGGENIVASHPANATFYISTAHESDRFNWTHSTHFTEDAKKKEVITYFDGANRNQQVVTRINTDNYTIVGETIYDHQGRPAIKVLPAPTNDSILGFYNNFNQASPGVVYSREDFDNDQGDCAILASPMVTDSGASRYYSPDNPNQNGEQAFVPDGQKYPFSHLEYEPDNTGRKRREGGVGINHQLGSGHETKFYYGKPSQEHLNRLFGAEVGVFSHYNKNLIVDANGQVSVTYQDRQNKTVATALAGNSPESLLPLDSNKENNPDQMTINVLDNQPGTIGQTTLTSSYHHLVSTAGEHSFNYSLQGARFEDEGSFPEDVCLDCVYDLVIDILDECGERPVLTPSTPELPIVVTIGTLDSLCNTETENYELTFSAYFDIGKYTITRSLQANQDAIELHTQTYINESDSVISLTTFIEESISTIDFSDCDEPDCESDCLSALGENASAEEIAACVLGCEFPAICEIAEELMIGDFTPGLLTGTFDTLTNNGESVAGGQYAIFEQIEVVEMGVIVGYTYEATDPSSILADNNRFNIHYSDPSIIYYDSNDPPQPAMVLNAAGELVTPNELPLNEFIENFEYSWARALVQFHPEQCYLNFCDSTNLGLRFDFLMRNTETYTEAFQLGLLNPLEIGSGAGVPSFTPPNGTWPLESPAYHDPFFGPDGLGNSLEGEMMNCMLNDTLTDPAGMNALITTFWQEAALLAGACEETVDSAGCQMALDNYAFSPLSETDICNRDWVWRFFRSLYLDKKTRIYEDLRADFVDGDPDCSNAILVGDGVDADFGDKAKRFPSYEDLITPDQLVLLNGPTQAELDDQIAENEAAIAAECAFRAESLSGTWLDKLIGCATDPETWLPGEPLYDEIKEAFVNIVLQTCDDGHPFGASSLPEDEIPVTPNMYNSFNEALIAIVGSGNIDLTCNADLISFPYAYDHDYSANTAYSPIDTCGCDLILTSDSLFYELQLTGDLPDGVMTAEELFEYEYEVEIDNYNGKVCACNDAFELSGEEWSINLPWDTLSQQALILENEFVPALVACQNCESCEDVVNLTNAYIAGLEADLGMPIDTSLSLEEYNNAQDMITNYLNNTLNLDLNYLEYQDFIVNCELLIEGDTSICHGLETNLVLEELLTDIVTNFVLDDSICLCAPPFVDELGEALEDVLNPDINFENGCDYVYYTETVSDTSIVSVITSASTNLDCTLELSFVEPGFLIENIVPPMFNVQPHPDSSPSNTYAFIVSVHVVVGNDVVVTTMEGNSSCFEISECITDASEMLICNYQYTNEIDLDCEENLIETATQNAINEYDGYLDSLIIDFQDDYMLQCLEATDSEIFDMSFADNEHHYTLYYYDQASNLVRTIPPAGVELVPEDKWDQIDTDREAGMKSVFTKHRMESRFKYNSINKMISKSIPDHDAFNDFGTAISTAGLPSDMDVTSTSFSDENNGVLFGVDPDDATQSVIFVSTDGGQSWTQVNDLGVENINDVQAYDASQIFAVGDQGAFLKTTDGGTSWSLFSAGTTEDLVGVYFESSDVNNGLSFTQSGIVLQTTDGGTSWSTLTTDLLAISTLEEIYFSTDNNGYAVGIENGRGAIYSTTTGGIVWAKSDEIQVGDLSGVQMSNGTDGYAVGVNGVLLKTSDGGESWNQHHTQNMHDALNSVHFSTTQNAIALTQNGELYSSSNGGSSWSLVSGTSGVNFTMMSFPTSNMGYALSDVNTVYKTNGSLTNWILASTISSSDVIHSIHFESDQVGYVSGENGAFFETTNAGFLWSSTGVGTGLLGTIIDLNIENGQLGIAKGTAINAAGTVYHSSGDLNSWSVSILPGGFSNAIDVDYPDASTGFVLSSSGDVLKTTDGGTNWSSVSNTGSTSLVKISFGDATNGVGVGSNGSIYQTNNAGVLWTEVSGNVIPLALHGVHAYGSNGYAVGDDGTLFKQSGIGQAWKMEITGSSRTFLSTYFKNSTNGLIGGTGGFLSYYNIAPAIPTSTDISIVTLTGDVNDVAIRSNTGLAVTENGGIFRTTNVGVDLLTKDIYPDVNPLNAVDAIGSEAIVVGNVGTILKNDNLATGIWDGQGMGIQPSVITASTTTPNGTMFATTENGTIGVSTDNGNTWTFIPVPTANNLNGIHFTDDNNGIAVGDGGAIFETTNGGGSWLSVSGAPLENLNDVFVLSPTFAFIVGDNGTILSLSSGTILTITSTPPTSANLNSIHFGGDIGYIAGDNGTLLKTEEGAGTSTFNQLLAPNSEDWVSYTDPNNASTTANLNDITCIDYTTAYAVGENGVIIKTIDGGVTWTRKESGSTEDLNEMSFTDNGNAILSGNSSGGATTAIALTDNADQVSTRFWYDYNGRLVVSQNSKQFSFDPPRYTYNKYDDLGRLIELGELVAESEPDALILSADNYPNNWSTNRLQINYTKYDTPYTDDTNALFGDNGQLNIRNRVSCSYYVEFYVENSNEYDYATHYSYDIHGNIKTMIHDNPELGHLGNRYKEIDYEYDLISGNVQELKFQEGFSDQFFHKFQYDADNRVEEVMTSQDGVLWDNDASFSYYDHGPISRIELGDQKVQGSDYAYNIIGWLKTVNSETNIASRDIGGDGTNGSLIAKDAFGFGLTYYSDDYQSISGSSQFLANINGTGFGNASPDLFNGNISKMVTAISPLNGDDDIEVQGMAYDYDQLNRLKNAKAYNGGVANSNSFSGANNNGDYNVSFDYDANGNIVSIDRKGHSVDGQNQNMDEFSYQYNTDVNGNLLQNRLHHVNDQVSAGNYSTDIDDQGSYDAKDEETWNYTYDANGSLIKDKQEEIQEIIWKADGRIQRVIREAGSAKPDLLFKYDALGNRIAKAVILKNVEAGNPDVIYTHYIRDAQGNTVAVYKREQVKTTNTIEESFKIAEQHLYGGKKLGVNNKNFVLNSGIYQRLSENELGECIVGNILSENSVELDTNFQIRFGGHKIYQLSNLTENVMVTISDRKLVDNGEFIPDVTSSNDYYPFGSLMEKRNFSLENSYRYSFNGFEKDDEVSGKGNHLSFGDFGYSTRLGRRWQVDPVDQAGMSSYAAFNNNPNFFVDPDGHSPISILIKMAAKVGLKKAAKEMIEKQVKKQLAKYIGKPKHKWAAQFLEDGLSAVDLAMGQSWWEYAIEVVPWVGDAYSAGKFTKQQIKVWSIVHRMEMRADAIVTGLKGGSTALKGAIKGGVKAGEQAHHIIPTQLLKESSVVQDAVAAGYKFNGDVNGVAVKAYRKATETGQHANHPAYNERVRTALNKWANDNKGYRPDEAKEFLEGLAGELKDKIKTESVKGGTKVNDLVF